MLFLAKKLAMHVLNKLTRGAVLRDFGLHMSRITKKLIEMDVFKHSFNWT